VSCPLKLVAGVPTSDSPFTVTVPLSKSPMLRQHTLGDYIAGVDTDEIARRHGVSHATASNIAARHGVLRNPHHSRDELVERIVGWFRRSRDDREARDAITRVGCRTRQPGLRSLEHLDSRVVDDVVRRLIEVLPKRYRH
jgi:hypothetical protein